MTGRTDGGGQKCENWRGEGKRARREREGEEEIRKDSLKRQKCEN
jgi:hypothetical protein